MQGSSSFKSVRGSSLRSPKQTTFSQSFASRPKAVEVQNKDLRLETRTGDSVRRSESQRMQDCSPSTSGSSNWVVISDRDLMKFEDMRSAYLRLEESSTLRITELEERCAKISSTAKSTRETALLTQKLELFSRMRAEATSAEEIKTQFEEVAIAYWLIAKESARAVNQHLHSYVKSLLQGAEQTLVSTENCESSKLFEQIAKLKRDLSAKDLANSMCRVQVNKLSTAVSGLLGQDLPLIQKYPELELPELCRVLTRLISDLIKCKDCSTVHVTKAVRPQANSGERESDYESVSLNRTLELQMEEVLFERDLARKQSAILQEIAKGQPHDQQKFALFERLYAKEDSLRNQNEVLMEKSAALQAEKQKFELEAEKFKAEMESLKTSHQELQQIRSISLISTETMTVSPSLSSQETDTSSLSTLADASTDPISVDTEEQGTDPLPPPEQVSIKTSTDSKLFMRDESTATQLFRLVSRGVDPICKGYREQGTNTESQDDTESPIPKPPLPSKAYESPAKVRRYRDSAMRKSMSMRTTAIHSSAIAEAEKVLETANKHLGAIQRTWNSTNARKLKSSMKERKGCATPLMERIDPVTPRTRCNATPGENYEERDFQEWESMRQEGARSTMHLLVDDISDVSFSSHSGDVCDQHPRDGAHPDLPRSNRLGLSPGLEWPSLLKQIEMTDSSYSPRLPELINRLP